MDKAFLTGQSWGILKSWYTDGGQNKDSGIVSKTDLTIGLVLSVAQVYGERK